MAPNLSEAVALVLQRLSFIALVVGREFVQPIDLLFGLVKLLLEIGILESKLLGSLVMTVSFNRRRE